MVNNEDDIPDYLKNIILHGPVKSNDNFGSEDIVWVGENGDLDPNSVVADFGREYRPELFQILRALIAGHRPKLDFVELEAQTRIAFDQIVGDRKSGTTSVDDGSLLMEIAYRYHDALYEAGKWPSGSIPLKPLVRAVVSEFGKKHRGKKMPTEASYTDVLIRKFNKHKDLWLSRATTEDRNYDPARMHNLEKVRAGLNLLAEAGIRVDVAQIRATTRPKP